MSPTTTKMRSKKDEEKSTTEETISGIGMPRFNKLNDSSDFRHALNQSRINKSFGDVFLTCDNVHLPAHKIVLAAKSKYFQEIFSSDTDESCTEVLVLQGVDPVVMESLLEFVYTGELNWQQIPSNKIQRLVMAGVRLSITNFCSYCTAKITEELSGTTFRNALDVADILKSSEMEQQVINYVADNLESLWITNDLMLMSERKMANILMAAAQRARSHDIVLRSLLAWVKHEVPNRLRALRTLMSTITLPKITTTYARFLLEEDSIVRDNIEVRDHILHLLHHKELEKEKLQIAVGDSGDKPTLITMSSSLQPAKSLDLKPLEGDESPPPPGSVETVLLAATSSIRAVDYKVEKPAGPCLIAIGTDEGHKLCISYYSIKLDQWTDAEILDTGIGTRHGLLYDRHCVYFVGGEDSQQFKLTKCFVRDLNSRVTRRLPDLRIPRSSPIVFVVGNALYVAGGAGRYSNSGLSHVEWLESLQAPAWKNGQPMREKRDMTASWSPGKVNKVYVVAGGSNKCEFFSCVSRTWNEMPTLPLEFKDVPCHVAIADERLFVMKQFNPNKVYCLDTMKGVWRSQTAKGIPPDVISQVTGWTTKIFTVDKGMNLFAFDVLTSTWYHVNKVVRSLENVKYLTVH